MKGIFSRKIDPKTVEADQALQDAHESKIDSINRLDESIRIVAKAKAIQRENYRQIYHNHLSDLAIRALQEGRRNHT